MPYDAAGADELCFFDIKPASPRTSRDNPIFDVVGADRRTIVSCRLLSAGGVATVAEYPKLCWSGADKCLDQLGLRSGTQILLAEARRHEVLNQMHSWSRLIRKSSTPLVRADRLGDL